MSKGNGTYQFRTTRTTSIGDVMNTINPIQRRSITVAKNAFREQIMAKKSLQDSTVGVPYILARWHVENNPRLSVFPQNPRRGSVAGQRHDRATPLPGLDGGDRCRCTGPSVGRQASVGRPRSNEKAAGVALRQDAVPAGALSAKSAFDPFRPRGRVRANRSGPIAIVVMCCVGPTKLTADCFREEKPRTPIGVPGSKPQGPDGTCGCLATDRGILPPPARLRPSPQVRATRPEPGEDSRALIRRSAAIQGVRAAMPRFRFVGRSVDFFFISISIGRRRTVPCRWMPPLRTPSPPLDVPDPALGRLSGVCLGDLHLFVLEFGRQRPRPATGGARRRGRPPARRRPRRSTARVDAAPPPPDRARSMGGLTRRGRGSAREGRRTMVFFRTRTTNIARPAPPASLRKQGESRPRRDVRRRRPCGAPIPARARFEGLTGGSSAGASDVLRPAEERCGSVFGWLAGRGKSFCYEKLRNNKFGGEKFSTTLE